MERNKKLLESAVVVVFTFAVMFVSAFGGNGNLTTEQEKYTEEIEAAEPAVATKERADVELVTASGQESDEAEAQEETEEAPEEEAQEETEAAPEEEAQEETEAAPEEEAQEETEAAPEEETQEETESQEEAQTEESSEWDNKLMPNVEEFLNIRTEANEEAELAGKLYKGAAADILERGEEWTKISSGSVEGYVKNEYCVYGQEAEAMAYEQGTVYATALSGGVRVRKEASAEDEVTILDVLEEGGKLPVATDAEAPEGWVAVTCSDQTAYISAEYVSVELVLGKAISIEEEQAAIRKAQEEKAAQEAKEAAATQEATRTQNAATEASYDDVTLLGALIQCEAGGECYEGQLAVGAVVMNRLRSGYAGSISGVIYQSGQFSPVSSGRLASVLASGVSGSCLQAAQEAINGVDNVGGAKYFRSASSGQSGVVIGNHVFY
jgi:outer membrane biosynthesis protein TonB